MTAAAVTPESFRALIQVVTQRIGNRPLDAALEADLNAGFPATGDVYGQILHSCRAAIEAGWMCAREAGGIRYGRVIRPAAELHGYSVDVVDMDRCSGPHHRHPGGEIDLIMPLAPDARFDGRGAGWLVYGPDSAHVPTVTGGRALVLYLLPQGAIEFSR